MPRALQAAAVLRSQLAEAGLKSGRIDLPRLWPTVSGWLRLSVDDIQDDASYTVMLFSQVPAASSDEMTFAGEAPAAIADRDLVCLEIGRDFARRIGPSSTEGITSAGIAVWFADSRDWQALAGEEDWIEMGVTTPNLDWGYRRRASRSSSPIWNDRVYSSWPSDCHPSPWRSTTRCRKMPRFISARRNC